MNRPVPFWDLFIYADEPSLPDMPVATTEQAFHQAPQYLDRPSVYDSSQFMVGDVMWGIQEVRFSDGDLWHFLYEQVGPDRWMLRARLIDGSEKRSPE